MRLTTTGRSPALTALAALTGTLGARPRRLWGWRRGRERRGRWAAPAPPSAAAYAGPVGAG